MMTFQICNVNGSLVVTSDADDIDHNVKKEADHGSIRQIAISLSRSTERTQC